MASDMSGEDSFHSARSELSGSEPFYSLPPSPSPPPPTTTTSLPPTLPPRTTISPSPSPTTTTLPAPPPSAKMAQPPAKSQVLDLGNGLFDLPLWQEPELREEFQDLFLSASGLTAFKHVPPLPWEYEREWAEKRCLFLFGVPALVTQDQVQVLLERWGVVMHLPLIIDLLSEEVFRFAIMASNAQAELVLKNFASSFPAALFPPEHHRIVAATTALAPGRGRIRGAVVVAQDDLNSFLEKPTIWGYNQELGPGQNQGSTKPRYTKEQMKLAIQKASGIIGSPVYQAVGSSSTRGFGWPSLPGNFQSPIPSTAEQPVSSSTPGFGIFDTPTTLRRRTTSVFADIFNTPSKVNSKENVDPKGKGKEREDDSRLTAPPGQRFMNNQGGMNIPVSQNFPRMNNNPYYGSVGQPAVEYTTQDHVSIGHNAYSGYTQSQTGAGSYYQSYASYQQPLPSAPPAVDPLVALLRKSAAQRTAQAPSVGRPAIPDTPDAQASTSASASHSEVPQHLRQAAAPIVPVLPIATPVRKASYPLVAVPDIALLNEQARAQSTSKGEPAPKTSSAKKATSAVKKTLATIPEASSTEEQAPKQEPAPVAKPAFSWAAVAGTLPSGSNTIDVSSKHANAVRLQALSRSLPAGGPNPSKTESLVEQMRVVFLLDIPTTITLNDVSDGLVNTGPLRSIHFGIDEEKQSRFCAIVFLHATDASKFTNALLKERADSRPSRFKFVVDVVRGEDPYPLDDIFRAMLRPNSAATRRLTLVKSGFFSANSKRKLTQIIERVVGQGYIQFIFLYNSGNATIVFSEVAIAMTMKAEFDRLSQNADTWRGLAANYSKDPCVPDANLKLIAVHEEWNH